MKPKTNIDGAFIRDARTRIDQALEGLGEELGVKFKAGSATMARDGSNGVLKLKILGKGDDGKTVDLDAAEFKRYAARYGLEPSHLGSVFELQGNRYELCGAKPRSIKYPLLGKRLPDGKIFKFAVLDVTRSILP